METVNAAKIAAYWHKQGYSWVQTWLENGYCRSNMRFVDGGRGPVQRLDLAIVE